MIINWYGGGCYKVAAAGFDLVVDPQSSDSGSRLKADLLVRTAVPFPLDNVASGEIIGPGEYEMSGVVVRGAPAAENGPKELRTIYKVLIDDITLGFIGDSSGELSEKALDMLGEIDILFVPSNAMGAKFIKQVGPKVAVPGWGDPIKVAGDIGQKPEAQEKLVIKKKDIEAMDGLKVVILES